MTSVVRGTCHHDCPDSCGWEVTVEAGTAVKMRGAKAHPYSLGELCPKVNRFLDRVYHPDRILTPLRRVGPKGSGAFEPVSWDEALLLCATELRRVIRVHGAEAVATWHSAGTQGLVQMSSLDQRFFANLGAAKQTGSLCGNTAKSGYALAYEGALSADPMDVQYSKLVVLWATNTKLTNRHLWPFIETARGNGAKVIVIDTVRTITADEADQFIQPRPGTDLSLALAVANVLIRDGLVDQEFVAEHATGFDEFCASVSNWSPARAAAVCGVEESVIEALAVELATAEPAMIRTLIGAEHHDHGGLFFQALGAIPVLTGSWRHRGGGLARSVGSWSELLVDDSVFAVPSSARSLNMNHVGRALVDPEMSIYAMFIWNGNPLVSTPNAGQFRQGLEREDLFCAVSEQFMTDTARYADVIFPACTQIEQVDVVQSWGSLYLGWNEPAIEPLGESVPNTELWRRLAKVMGMEDPEFSLTDEELIESALVGVSAEDLRREAWVRLPAPDHATPFTAGLQRANLPNIDPAVVAGLGTVARADEFVLLTVKKHPRFMNSTYSAHHGPRESAPMLEIHPEDAAARGVGEGDVVEIANEKGSLRMAAKHSDRVGRGVLLAPWGWWGEELNVNLLTSDELTDHGGGVRFFDTAVTLATNPSSASIS